MLGFFFFVLLFFFFLIETGYQSVAPAGISVSYTQLRDNEPVLDLVCRLLIEKKNKNKQQTKQQKNIVTLYNVGSVHKICRTTSHNFN